MESFDRFEAMQPRGSRSSAVFEQVRPGRNEQERILEQFTPEERSIIRSRQELLSSLAYFIGKDFKIPILLNEPGEGWHWNWEENHIKIDPKDLLEKPIDYLRFVISHEAGHRRISRADVLPRETLEKPGFSFMLNAIEDPRDNNFVAEAYPRFRQQMKLAYELDQQFEQEAKKAAKEDLGQTPRFVQAGLEYIKQWFREVQEQTAEIDKALPAEVQEVVTKTLAAAQDAWWRYPSKEEANKGEKIIRKYATKVAQIALKKVWPEFQKLVEQDQKDQEAQQALDQMQQPEGDTSGEAQGEGQPQPSGAGSRSRIPEQLKKQLSEEEQKELERAIEQAIESAQGKAQQGGQGSEDSSQESPQEGAPSQAGHVDQSSFSDELKKKIREYIESLTEDQRKQLETQARQAIKDFEDKLNEELQGKFSQSESEELGQGSESEEGREPSDQRSAGGSALRSGEFPDKPVEVDPSVLTYRERVERLVNLDENLYEKYRREVLPLIDKLESELREIFVDRETTAWKGGFRVGKRIDIKRRIQEKAKSISPAESKAWQKRELPDKNDYAITLLVDLSGSMRKEKRIEETFKSVIVLVEVLNRLGVDVEVLGFNDDLYEYQNFGQPLSKKIREHMGGMPKEVDDSCCKGCGNEHSETDLGWATSVASQRLAQQKTARKILITLSDGILAGSSKHPGRDNEIAGVVKNILKDTDIRPVGLGVGTGTESITQHYPGAKSVLTVKEMVDTFPDLLREIIAK